MRIRKARACVQGQSDPFLQDPQHADDSVVLEDRGAGRVPRTAPFQLLGDLRVKEFAVLEALMSAEHAVLSAEDLFAQVWDENVLREPPVIETITNSGYRMTGSPDDNPASAS